MLVARTRPLFLNVTDTILASGQYTVANRDEPCGGGSDTLTNDAFVPLS